MIKVIYLSLVFVIAMTSVAYAEGPGPVPPCPFEITMKAPDPSLPEDVKKLYGKWVGDCEDSAGVYRHVRMIVYEINGKTAKILYGYGSSRSSTSDFAGGSLGQGGSGSSYPAGEWHRIDAEIAASGLTYTNKRRGIPTVFKWKGDTLVRVDPPSFTTTLRREP